MIKRYELGSDWGGCDEPITCIVEDPTGDYVLHEDYEKLRDASAQLVAALRAADYVWPGVDIERQTALFGARRKVEELLRD